MINGVDGSDPTCSFTADEWNRICSNGGCSYVAQAREGINGRGHVGQGGGRDGGREYGCGGGPRNVNETKFNKGEEHDYGQQREHGHGQGGQGKGKGRGAVHGSDRIGCNGTGFGRGAYN